MKILLVTHLLSFCWFFSMWRGTALNVLFSVSLHTFSSNFGLDVTMRLHCLMPGDELTFISLNTGVFFRLKGFGFHRAFAAVKSCNEELRLETGELLMLDIPECDEQAKPLHKCNKTQHTQHTNHIQYKEQNMLGLIKCYMQYHVLTASKYWRVTNFTVTFLTLIYANYRKSTVSDELNTVNKREFLLISYNWRFLEIVFIMWIIFLCITLIILILWGS